MFKLIIVVIIVVSFVAYLKYFEKANIFYPTSEIFSTPKDINLNYEDVFIRTEDNLILNGWFIEKEEKAPTILFFHGNAGNISDRLEIIKMFALCGLNVFIFDYRGYGRSEGRPTEKGIYLDTLSVYKYLTEEKRILPKDIFVYGESLGCVFAIYLADKEDIGLLILQSPFSSAIDMATVYFPWIPKFFLKSIMSVEFDNIFRIKKIKVPKLIIHSVDDEIVPFKLAEKLFIEASPPKEFYVMRGLHNESVYKFKDEYITKLKDFIKKYKNL